LNSVNLQRKAEDQNSGTEKSGRECDEDEGTGHNNLGNKKRRVKGKEGQGWANYRHSCNLVTNYKLLLASCSNYSITNYSNFN